MADEKTVEEQISEALGIEPEVGAEVAAPEGEEAVAVIEDDPEEVEAEPFTVDKWQESQENEARVNGWKPLDEYIADGKEPKDWVSAEGFNIRGEFIGKLRSKDREVERIVDERVSGVKKLYEAKINDLKGQRTEAIEEGDVAKVESIEKAIDDLQRPAAPMAQQKDPALEAEWNQKNPWVLEETPKSLYAVVQYNKHLNRGMATAEALAKMEIDVAAEFPVAKPPNGKIPSSEKGNGSKGFSKKSSSPSVTLSDLTNAEKAIWGNMPEAWGNDINKFLKAVSDDRAQG